MNSPDTPDQLPGHRVVIRAAVGLMAVLVLARCTAPISVRQVEPDPPIGSALETDRAAPILDELRATAAKVAAGDGSVVVRYNYLVGRLLESVEESVDDPWSRTLGFQTPGGTRQLTTAAPPGMNLEGFRLVPADTLEFHGRYSDYRSTVPGLGAPVVAVRSFEGIGHEQFRKNQPLRNLTAVVRFDGPRAKLELLDPYQVEQVGLGPRRYPLAASYHSAVMIGMSKARVDKLGLARLLRPSRYNDTAILNFLQPYDPDRIPVLLVHGLMDTPATWAPLYFRMLEDPVIRKNYQFWVFSYPSGYPYPYSASLLRRELDAVNRDFPDHRDLVIVGHSMGSLVSRLMVTDVGDRIWIKAFGKPPAKTPIGGKSRELLEAAVVFDHREEIDRAVFLSGPHRGSELASNWIGTIGIKLVRLPHFMADVRTSVVSAASADESALLLHRAPNSIDTLSPENPFVKAVNEIPIYPGIPYHSIMGDRGKGDTPDSSDGVVAYWSSHLDGAVSEKIVPSGHGAHQHPEGIEEVHRILRLHLEDR